MHSCSRFTAVALLVAASGAGGQLKREPPKALTDAEFWSFFTTMSEPSGQFPSENFVSNEVEYQNVIPTLQRNTTQGGVYLGVGPEQNFTYIANLRPRFAVIVDIRRQNAMLHLMYKAIFEQSPSRADFVARLFSRPAVMRVRANATAALLFDSAAIAAPVDSAYQANLAAIERSLTVTHGFTLSTDDIASIEHVYSVFYANGPDVNYASHANSMFRATYATFGMLQTATNADSVPMAFLATENNYRTVRGLEGLNLIIPVVGDFAGPKAIRSVGEYLRQRSLTLSAFYLSNVEQYLFQNRVADQFYENVATLPIDTTSTFIRSVPRGRFGGGMSFPSGSGVAVGGFGGGIISGGSGTYRFSITDSAGVRVIRSTYDSAGQQVTRVTRDTARIGMGAPSGRRIIMSGTLTSGIAPIRETLAAQLAGQIMTYQDIITMTKTSGWK